MSELQVGLPRERGFAELFRIGQGKTRKLASGSLSFASTVESSPESTLDGEEPGTARCWPLEERHKVK